MLLNKFNRIHFLSQDTNANDELEWDLILSNWDLFAITRPIAFDSVKQGDVQRPDLLSYRIYGASTYWWILCKFNQIDDVWNDMYVGMDLIIPDRLDIEDFYGNMRRRARANV